MTNANWLIVAVILFFLALALTREPSTGSADDVQVERCVGRAGSVC